MDANFEAMIDRLATRLKEAARWGQLTLTETCEPVRDLEKEHETGASWQIHKPGPVTTWLITVDRRAMRTRCGRCGIANGLTAHVDGREHCALPKDAGICGGPSEPVCPEGAE